MFARTAGDVQTCALLAHRQAGWKGALRQRQFARRGQFPPGEAINQDAVPAAARGVNLAAIRAEGESHPAFPDRQMLHHLFSVQVDDPDEVLRVPVAHRQHMASTRQRDELQGHAAQGKLAPGGRNCPTVWQHQQFLVCADLRSQRQGENQAMQSSD